MNPWIKSRMLVAACLMVAVAVPSKSTPPPVTPNPVPLVSSITPGATAPGSTGFTLFVNGTGFVPTSTVQWNGNARATTFISSSKVSAAISASDIASAGTATITVVSPLPGGGLSNPEFLQIENPSSQLYFTSSYVTGKVTITSPMVEGDFDKDGKLDLIGAVGSTVYFMGGNGDGTFRTPVGSSGPAGSTITSVNVADVNGDGKLDLIVSGSKSSTTSFVATMLGAGDGTFLAPIETDFSGVHFPAALVAGDFNADGTLDLAYTTAVSVQTLLSNGDGTFRMGPSSSLAQIGLNVVGTADFNKDGKLDLVVTVYDPFTTGLDYAGVMAGNGDGSFGTLSALPGSGSAFVGAITAVVADFNGDGNPDIATAIETAGSTIQGFLQISLGNGDGTFQSATSVPNVNAVTTPLLVGDFNGDGFLDLVTGNYAYFGQGDGTFPTSQGSSGGPTDVLAGDFNGDGQLDIVDEGITLNGSTVLKQVGMMLQIPPTPDFKGIVAPFTSTLVPGGSVSITVTLEPLNGFTGDVVVSASNLPTGVTPSYNPVLVHGGSGTTIVTLTASPSVALGDYTITLTGNSGTLSHSTSVPIVVNSSVGDWTGYVAQQAKDIAPGAAGIYTIVTTPVNGFNGNIALTVSGLPPGATATFNPTTITGGSGSSVLTVSTLSSTPQPQIYNMTITGTNGILVHDTTVYLGVSTGTGDFTGAITPSSQSVSSATGGSAAFSLTLTPSKGGAGDVTLSASGLPAGVTGAFSPAAIIPASSGTSTLTLTVPAGTPQGTYQVFITSTGTGVIHQGSATLVVTP